MIRAYAESTKAGGGSKGGKQPAKKQSLVDRVRGGIQNIVNKFRGPAA